MKHVIKKVEFYITNVCNLTCDHCNRFNNYNFKGWQNWNDYKDVYRRWAEYVDIEQIVFLGGEPLLNSSLNEWLKGIHELWPNCWKQILTNGYRLNQVKDLYQTCVDTKSWVGISLHNIHDKELLFDEVRKFLPGPLVEEHGPANNRYGADYCFQSFPYMRIPLWVQNNFTTSAVKTTPEGKYTLHNSNPELAHNICPMAMNKSYHFINGKLYKCGPVALFPEFDEQFGLDLSSEDRHLMNSYRPLTVDDFPTRGAEFLSNIDNVIPQCKFCDAHPAPIKIFPMRKGKNVQ